MAYQTNPFASMPPTLEAPSSSAGTITPNDATDLSAYCKRIYVGGTGSVTLIGVDDTVSVTFAAVPAGSILPVGARRVLATGTTATKLVALY